MLKIKIVEMLESEFVILEADNLPRSLDMSGCWRCEGGKKLNCKICLGDLENFQAKDTVTVEQICFYPDFITIIQKCRFCDKTKQVNNDSTSCLECETENYEIAGGEDHPEWTKPADQEYNWKCE
jgi:hypothetical protein